MTDHPHEPEAEHLEHRRPSRRERRVVNQARHRGQTPDPLALEAARQADAEGWPGLARRSTPAERANVEAEAARLAQQVRDLQERRARRPEQ